MKNQEFRNLLRMFRWHQTEKTLQAGEKILLFLLGGKRGKSLDKLCVHKYHEKMSRQTQHSVEVEALGPTSDAA